MIASPAVLALALVGWAWWGQPLADAEAPSVAQAASQASTLPAPTRPAWAPPEVRPAVRQAPTTAAPAADTGLASLLTAPEASLRATLQAALAARAQGGRLYARALAHRCAALAGLPPPAAPPDANDPRHQRALARQAGLASGCSQFANGEWLSLVNIAADEPTADDPLLTLLEGGAGDAALLEAAMARPDPLLLDELGPRLLLRRIGGEPVLYFDGRRFDDEASRATALAAVRLLPCHFGLACDERDPEVWMACLRGDGCQASRAEQGPPEAPALAARLAQALRARELHRFLPAPPS